MTNTIAEEAWQDILARYDGMADLVDQSIARSDAQIANARSEYSGLNLLKNANAKESDGAGGYHSPLNIYTGDPGSTTTGSQRVLTLAEAQADATVPSEIVDKMQSAIAPTYTFNLIEVTVSQNGGTGQFRLMSSAPVYGHATVGALFVQVAEAGIRMKRSNYASAVSEWTDLEPGTLYTNMRRFQNDFTHIDGMPSFVEGENKKMWVLAPFFCAGRFTGDPLFLNEPSRFYIGDAN